MFDITALENRKRRNLTPNSTFEFIPSVESHTASHRIGLSSSEKALLRLEIATPPMRNAKVFFASATFELTFHLNSTTKVGDASCKMQFSSSITPGLYNIRRTEMGEDFECWAATGSTLCKHCTGTRRPNGIETRNIHVNGIINVM